MNEEQTNENQNMNMLREHNHEPVILLKRDKAILRKKKRTRILIILSLFVIGFLIAVVVHNEDFMTYFTIFSVALIPIFIYRTLSSRGSLSAPFEDHLTIANGKIYYDHYWAIHWGTFLPTLYHEQIRVNSVTGFEEDKKYFIIHGDIEYDTENHTIYGREEQKIPKHFMDIHLLKNFLEQQSNSRH